MAKTKFDYEKVMSEINKKCRECYHFAFSMLSGLACGKDCIHKYKDHFKEKEKPANEQLWELLSNEVCECDNFNMGISTRYYKEKLLQIIDLQEKAIRELKS